MARLARALAALALLVSCRSFDFERQQIFLRYEPETDVLDALLVYEGVGAPKDLPSETESTTQLLRRIGEGRRHVILLDWFLDFDLDGITEEKSEFELEQRLLEYLPAIQVLEARFLLDAREQLCLLQRIRVREASAGLRLLDAALNRASLAALEVEPKGDESDPLENPGTRERLRRRGEAQGSWARFDGTSVVVSIPMSPQGAAELFRNLLASAREDGEKGKAWTEPNALASILVDGEELRLTFSPAPDGWMQFTFVDPERTYRPAVAEGLVREGIAAKADLAAEITRLKALR